MADLQFTAFPKLRPIKMRNGNYGLRSSAEPNFPFDRQRLYSLQKKKVFSTSYRSKESAFSSRAIKVTGTIELLIRYVRKFYLSFSVTGLNVAMCKT